MFELFSLSLSLSLSVCLSPTCCEYITTNITNRWWLVEINLTVYDEHIYDCTTFNEIVHLVDKVIELVLFLSIWNKTDWKLYRLLMLVISCLNYFFIKVREWVDLFTEDGRETTEESHNNILIIIITIWLFLDYGFFVSDKSFPHSLLLFRNQKLWFYLHFHFLKIIIQF